MGGLGSQHPSHSGHQNVHSSVRSMCSPYIGSTGRTTKANRGAIWCVSNLYMKGQVNMIGEAKDLFGEFPGFFMQREPNRTAGVEARCSLGGLSSFHAMDAL